LNCHENNKHPLFDNIEEFTKEIKIKICYDNGNIIQKIRLVDLFITGCDDDSDWNNPENECILDHMIRYLNSDNVKEGLVPRELDVDIYILSFESM